MSMPLLPTGAVLFDLDDTLHDDTATYRRAASCVAAQVARTDGVDAQALLASYVTQAERFWRELSDASLSIPMAETRARLWAAALTAIGRGDDELARSCADSYNRFRREFLVLWPGVLALLADLRRGGSKLGLITNGLSETHREKIELLGLGERFDVVFIADEVGMVKPNPALFTLACERLGVDASDATMVGDRFYRDIVGAHRAGIATLWLDIHGERLAPADPLPTAVARTIPEVRRALLGAEANVCTMESLPAV